MIWQNRQLDEFYPVIFLDALRIKVRDGGRVVNKSAYMAIGVDLDGIKHILGLWIAKEEGASFWAHVCANLSNRGVKDVFIVCCDGLKGLPEAVEATWPNSMVQTCIVHLIRAANRWVAYGDRKSVSAALKKVYTATDESTAEAALKEFSDSELGVKYPQSVKVWRDAWDRFVPFLQFPPAARKVIYTTNSIESFNNQLRKATRNRVQFTNDESALKTLWLMICNIEDKRAAKRAKQGKRASATASRLVEGPDPQMVDTLKPASRWEVRYLSTMPRKTYTEQFKRDAVSLYESTPGATLNAIASDLGVNRNSLRTWLDAFGTGTKTNANGEKVASPIAAANSARTPAEGLSDAERIRVLERENAKLREEREILRKAAKYFAEETNW